MFLGAEEDWVGVMGSSGIYGGGGYVKGEGEIFQEILMSQTF